MSTAVVIGLICSLISNVIVGVGGLIVDLILMYKSFMPTDPVGGLLDIAKEPFVDYLPYINCFMSFMRKYWLEISLEKIKID